MDPQPHSGHCAHRVLEAAMDVFCEEGYRGSIDAVSQRAGVARQTIYNNFGSKEKLFDEALRHAVVNLFSFLTTAEGSLEERLFQFGLHFREIVLSEKNLKMLRLMISEAPRFPELAAGFYNIFASHGLLQIAGILEQAMKEGLLRQEDPGETAQVFLDMLISAEKTRRLLGNERTSMTPASETKNTRRIVAAFLRAYAAHPLKTQSNSSPEDRPIS